MLLSLQAAKSQSPDTKVIRHILQAANYGTRPAPRTSPLTKWFPNRLLDASPDSPTAIQTRALEPRSSLQLPQPPIYFYLPPARLPPVPHDTPFTATHETQFPSRASPLPDLLSELPPDTYPTSLPGAKSRASESQPPSLRQSYHLTHSSLP